MIRNTYAFELLNTWDGKLNINETDGYILSKLIGAGTKNQDNEYTGVLMGAVGDLNTNAVTGLYGFQDGEMRFKLDENGEFYVGTGEDNHISFTNEDFEIKTDSITIEAQDDDNTTTKLYLSSDEPKQIGNDEYYVYLGNGAFSMNTNGVVQIGGNDKAQINLPTDYGLNNQLSSTPTNWYKWFDVPENWEQEYLYLWTRTRMSSEAYNYKQQISS